MINKEINQIIEFSKNKGKNITPDQAFNVLVAQYLFFKEEDLEKIWSDLELGITDGSNDGGLDFVFFDEEENRIIIGQNKYSNNIQINDFKAEMSKIRETLSNFQKTDTGRYNQKVKENLQNNIDRLTDESQGNIDVYFTSLSDFNHEKAMLQIADFSQEVNEVIIFNEKDLLETIEKVR